VHGWQDQEGRARLATPYAQGLGGISSNQKRHFFQSQEAVQEGLLQPGHLRPIPTQQAICAPIPIPTQQNRPFTPPSPQDRQQARLPSILLAMRMK